MAHIFAGTPEYEAWEAGPLARALDRSAERPQSSVTGSGLPLERIGMPATGDREAYASELGFPGEFPYTRGIHPTMYRGRLWTMRQYSGFGTAEQTNERFKHLISQGQTGLSIAFDLPTQLGMDSDHPRCVGEVGRVGVAIDSLRDMEILYDGIPLEEVSTSMTINATAPILLAFYVALARQRGVALGDLRGTVQNDILKEYVARGTYIFPPAASLRLTTDIVRYCVSHVPSWYPISISGYHMREAGCTAVHEVAFTIAHGLAYVQSATDIGLDVDAFAPRLSFFFGCHNDLLEEVAKFRAARRLWARLMADRFAPTLPASTALRFHTQTCGSTLTSRQPYNNVVRVALQALAAVLGGTQSLHTNSLDEALGLPTEETATLALRTQQILAHEAGVANTVDPLGGSYAVEALTDRIEQEARDLIEEIDELGGAVQAVEAGFMQRQIQTAAYAYQSQIDRGERVLVGVNQYESDEVERPAPMRADPDLQRRQIARTTEVKAQRDAEAVRSCLARIETAAASSSDEIMPLLVDAAAAYATVGEISDVFRACFGEHKETLVL